MVKFVKGAFDPLGILFKNKPEGPTEAEQAAQAKQRSDEEQTEAELLARGPSRTTGRARKIGRQLLSFLGPSTTKTTTGGGRATPADKTFRGPRTRIR